MHAHLQSATIARDEPDTLVLDDDPGIPRTPAQALRDALDTCLDAGIVPEVFAARCPGVDLEAFALTWAHVPRGRSLTVCEHDGHDGRRMVVLGERGERVAVFHLTSEVSS